MAVVLWLCASTALADQYAYVSLRQAVDAMNALTQGSVVHSFCAPCNDKASRPMRIRLLEIGRVWEGTSAVPYRSSDGVSYWEVSLNDEPIDLAYVYIRRGTEWENLAMVLGLAVVDVPRYLAPSQVGQRKRLASRPKPVRSSAQSRH
jgi:hypothetical protein